MDILAKNVVLKSPFSSQIFCLCTWPSWASIVSALAGSLCLCVTVELSCGLKMSSIDEVNRKWVKIQLGVDYP